VRLRESAQEDTGTQKPPSPLCRPLCVQGDGNVVAEELRKLRPSLCVLQHEVVGQVPFKFQLDACALLPSLFLTRPCGMVVAHFFLCLYRRYYKMGVTKKCRLTLTRKTRPSSGRSKEQRACDPRPRSQGFAGPRGEARRVSWRTQESSDRERNVEGELGGI
jgi:hypothetical protein